MGNVILPTTNGTHNIDASLIIGLLELDDRTVVELEDGMKIVVSKPFKQVYKEWEEAGGEG